MTPEDAAAQGGPTGRDRLSGLSDKILFKVMEYLKTWEVVRTCALSKRWRYLWASASKRRLDIRQPCSCRGRDVLRGRRLRARENAFASFVKTLLLRRPPMEPLDSLRLCWSHETNHGHANIWVAHAVRHGAEVIELSGKHHDEYPSPEYMSFIVRLGDYGVVETRLKALKLIHVRLDGTTLTQLCSRCTCLKELELKDCVIPDKTKIQTDLLGRLTMVRCEIKKGLSIHALNLVYLQFSRNLWFVPWIQNLGLLAASNIMKKAPNKYPESELSNLFCNLKTLKLSRVMLDDTTLAQLCSRCTSLQDLDLNGCSVVDKEIQSNSLRCLSMINCKFATGSGVHAPNLLSLRCIRPFEQVPRFGNMEFLVTATIALDDSCMSNESWWTWVEDDKDESDHDDGDFFSQPKDSNYYSDHESSQDEDESDHDDSDDNSANESSQDEEDESDHDGRSLHYRAEVFDVPSDNESDLDEKDESHIDGPHSSAEESDHNTDVSIDKFDDNNDDESYLNDNIGAHSGAEDLDDNQGSSGPGDEVDGCTVGCDEIAEKYNGACGGKFGGDGLLHSLSNVRTLDLSAHSGEVLLMRESKSCTNFNNLETLSLGEWCITPDLDVLASMLKSSPNLENLFVHLDMANKIRVGFNPEASSFTCTNLKKVEITCCEHDDDMVHILTELFNGNGITQKIFVRRTTCTCDVKRNTGSQAKRKAQTESEKRPEKQIKPGY